MMNNLVLTLTGADRIGIVEEVTQLLFEHGGNVETSRMARLGGDFAMIMLVSIPPDRLADVEIQLERWVDRGYKVTTTLTDESYAKTHPGWLPYRIEVRGADHEGIIHQIARHLSQGGINIESMDTETVRAPISGSLLFAMTARVVAPPDLREEQWQADLKKAGHLLNVDVRTSSILDK
jgi:glycine cleavage system transcriptional repressor